MATKKDKDAQKAKDEAEQGVPITDIDPAGEGTSFADEDKPRDGTKMSEGPVPVLDAKAAAELRANRADEQEQGEIRAKERAAMVEANEAATE
jgi:hypothetical protein